MRAGSGASDSIIVTTLRQEAHSALRPTQVYLYRAAVVQILLVLQRTMFIPLDKIIFGVSEQQMEFSGQLF